MPVTKSPAVFFGPDGKQIVYIDGLSVVCISEGEQYHVLHPTGVLSGLQHTVSLADPRNNVVGQLVRDGNVLTYTVGEREERYSLDLEANFDYRKVVQPTSMYDTFYLGKLHDGTIVCVSVDGAEGGRRKFEVFVGVKRILHQVLTDSGEEASGGVTIDCLESHGTDATPPTIYDETLAIQKGEPTKWGPEELTDLDVDDYVIVRAGIKAMVVKK